MKCAKCGRVRQLVGGVCSPCRRKRRCRVCRRGSVAYVCEGCLGVMRDLAATLDAEPTPAVPRLLARVVNTGRLCH